MPPIDWTAIVLAVIAAIKECREQPDDQIVFEMRKPSARQRLRFERRIRLQLNYGPLEWMKVGRDVMAEIDAELDLMTDADLLELITQAKAA